MIDLNQQLCEELDLTYWQLNQTDAESCIPLHTINREERELLRKILLAKSITLSDNILEIQDHGIVVVKTKSYQLVFDDVNLEDTTSTAHLAKLSDMLNSAQQKKHTWYKLKDIDL